MKTLLRFHDGSEMTTAQACELVRPARDFKRLRQLKRQRRMKALLRIGLAVLGWLVLAVMVLAFVAGIVFLYIGFTA